MKRIWIAILAVLMMVLLCAPALAAEGAEAMLKVSMEISTNEFSGPKEISVTIKLTNTSEKDTPGPVTLYYPDGKIIEEFGAEVLAAGQSKSWSGTWNVPRPSWRSRRSPSPTFIPPMTGTAACSTIRRTSPRPSSTRALRLRWRSTASSPPPWPARARKCP